MYHYVLPHQKAGLGEVAQSSNQHAQVTLSEARPEAFHMVLWFIYTDKLDWRPEGSNSQWTLKKMAFRISKCFAHCLDRSCTVSVSMYMLSLPPEYNLEEI